MDMKKVGHEMSLLMGLSMSFILTIVGMLTAKRFTIPGFLKSFLISFVISVIIGLIIPMKKVSDVVQRKFEAKPGTLKARILDALVSDVLYSPLMTLIMVYLAYREATSHGARIPFGSMLLKSEIISFITAFILSFILTPVFMKIVMKRNAVR
ncbi:MAG: hypothetical protein IIZ74_04020 [Erysipelotrichaceae bacterium]|nr:hypothetical protein [Erysipelotrichaceae bacterium]